MWIFKKAFSILLLTLIFVGAMFVSVDFSLQSSESYHLSVSFDVAYAATSVDSTVTVGETNTSKVTTTENGDSTKEIQSAFKKAVSWINVIFAVLSVLISPFIMFAGWLISPDWVTGEIFWLREYMYKIWIVFSNIIYFVYAIALIIVAIATIFNSEKYGYKRLLSRLLIGIVMVPMTWFFVQFVLSVSTVATSAVLEIPRQLVDQKSEDWAQKTFWTTESIPKDINAAFTDIGELGNWKTQKLQCNKENPCVSPSQFVDKSGGIYSPLIIYAYGIFKIHTVTLINTDGIDILTNLSSIVTQSLVSMLMFLVFGCVTIALVLILFVRAIQMWLYAMISPLFSVNYVFNGLKLQYSEHFSIGQFLGLAFIPAVVWLILSFGLIVVSALNTWLNGSTPSGDGNANTNQSCLWQPGWDEPGNSVNGCTLVTLFGNPVNTIKVRIAQKCKAEDKECNAKSATPAQWVGVDTKNEASVQEYQTVTTITIGGVSMRYFGSLEKGTDLDALARGDSNAATSLLGIFGNIIVQFAAIAFIWLAFKSMGSMNKIANKIVDSVADKAETFAAYTGKNIPLPKSVGGSVGASMYLYNQLGNRIRTSYDTKFQQDAANSSLGKMMGIKSYASANDNINSATNNAFNITADKLNDTNAGKQITNTAWTGPNSISIANTQTALNAIQTEAKTNPNADDMKSAVRGIFSTMFTKIQNSSAKPTPRILAEALVRSWLIHTKAGGEVYRELIDMNVPVDAEITDVSKILWYLDKDLKDKDAAAMKNYIEEMNNYLGKGTQVLEGKQITPLKGGKLPPISALQNITDNE